MLQSYTLPKRLKTVHHPNKIIELWINEKRVSSISDVDPSLKLFVQDFVSNLEEKGWKVLTKK
ncbi:MAG: hypothetical protein ACTSPV_04700 [Candidatus Hodarchaeales archaeon]